MFGFNRTSGLPQVETKPNKQREDLVKLHEFAKMNNQNAKLKMENEYNVGMRKRESKI